jgi:uncharacterized protein (TIGR00369 family)
MTALPEISGLDAVLAVTHPEVTKDRVVAQWTIAEQHLQSLGIPHGGAYCAVHESTASMGAVMWLDGKAAAVGTNNSTDFLRQAKLGDMITTTATPIHRGRTQQLWRVESVDQESRLIAQGQVRLANIALP